jgi:riboflavin biosynthesis pyrimidine reductase
MTLIATDEKPALRRLFGTDEQRGRVRHAALPAALRERYDGDLIVSLVDGRPTVIANFVSTLDGVVTFDPDSGNGGGEVSGFFEPDRLVMALLRAVADFVVVGAGTVRADPRGRWIAASIHPTSARETSAIRAALGLAAQPTTVLVTGSGDVPVAHPGLNDPSVPVLIATTRHGAARLASEAPLAPHIEVVALDGERIAATAVLDAISQRGGELVLCEGGPHLIADFLSEQLLDELFLTVAPQLAGRADSNGRLALVEGVAFDPDEAPWAGLTDVRVAGSHLFTRYQFGRKDNDRD